MLCFLSSWFLQHPLGCDTSKKPPGGAWMVPVSPSLNLFAFDAFEMLYGNDGMTNIGKKPKGVPSLFPSWFHHVSPGFLWDSLDISQDISLRFRSLKFCSHMSPCWYHQCIDFLRAAKLQAPCNAFLVDDQPLKSAPQNIYQDKQNSIFDKQKTWCFPTLFNMLSPVFNCFAPKLPSGNLT